MVKSGITATERMCKPNPTYLLCFSARDIIMCHHDIVWLLCSYFAEDAAYVDGGGYAHVLPAWVDTECRERDLILAHVLCGRQFDFGHSKDTGLKRPPQFYDSVKVRSDLHCKCPTQFTTFFPFLPEFRFLLRFRVALSLVGADLLPLLQPFLLPLLRPRSCMWFIVVLCPTLPLSSHTLRSARLWCDYQTPPLLFWFS